VPLYEYLCRKCSRRFEALVTGRSRPSCPDCRSEDLEKLFSTFVVGGGGKSSDGEAEPIAATGPCGTCGDPRGPGSCAVNWPNVP
jgi:putative FmdB family regulatory protein